MQADSFYIGMDLGGTTFKALAVAADGTILGRVQGDTQSGRGRETVVQRMAEAVRRLQADVSSPTWRLAAVGFGIPGILELPAGVVRRSPNLPGWEGFDLYAALRQQVEVPISIENDANAAVVGEGWLGAGRDQQHFLMLTLGTGVGGGVVVAGQILHGVQGYAGEVGHTVVDPNGPLCRCGSHGCLEQFASGTAVARMAAPYYGEVTAKDVALAAQRGEPQALEVYKRVGQHSALRAPVLPTFSIPSVWCLGEAWPMPSTSSSGLCERRCRSGPFPKSSTPCTLYGPSAVLMLAGWVPPIRRCSVRLRNNLSRAQCELFPS